MTGVSSARRDWAHGYQRFLEGARQPGGSDVLHEQLDELTGEIRRRVGGTFTLAELVDVYAASEHWAREVIEERAPSPRSALTLADSTDAAFHLYSRGAQDYAP